MAAHWPSLDLDALRVLTLVADLGSISAAARAEQIGQSSASTRIQGLERLHHTPESGTVVVAVDGRTAAAEIRVVDSGVGTTPGTRQHAFDRFWRADESRSQPGHGLGLALVRQIMTAHGGHATISATPGGGTTVSLAIPRWTGGSGESSG
jgi:light-regulated signal transduction histidine kinase (bacteriophytochrome)